MLFITTYKSIRDNICVSPLSKGNASLLKRKSLNLNLFYFPIVLLVVSVAITIIRRDKNLLILIPYILAFMGFTWTCLAKRWYSLFEFSFLGACVLVPVFFTATENFKLYAPIFGVCTNITIQLFTETKVLSLAQLVLSMLINTLYVEPVAMEFIAGNEKKQIAENVAMAISLNTWQVYLSAVILLLLRRYNEKLISEVNELRTDLSLANRKLVKQNEELERSLETKDLFLMTFSHEMKNALNGLLGNINLIGQRVSDDGTVQLLQSAQACGEILKNFVYNLLDYSHCENGELHLTNESCSTSTFFEKTWGVMKELIQNKRLDGFLKISKDVPSHLLMDKQKLFQIILNLTSNAVKFTEKGKVYIVVQWIQSPSALDSQFQFGEGVMKTESELDEDLSELGQDISEKPRMVPVLNAPGWANSFYKLDLEKTKWASHEVFSSRRSNAESGTLKIMVVDNGCGIDESDIETIFAKRSPVNFQRAREKQLGVGIGLWITKNLVERLGGKIRAKSKRMAGSSFDILIPAKVIEKDSLYMPEEFKACSDKSLPSSLASEMNIGFTPLKSVKSTPAVRPLFHAVNHEIMFANLNRSRSEGTPPVKDVVLIADDDHFNVEFLSNCCRSIGKKCIVAYDGEEALKLYKAKYDEICLVLTDNTMPKISGVQLAQEISKFALKKAISSPSVYVITGDAKAIRMNRNLENDDGITNVLMKPVDMNRIISIILSHC